MTDPCRSLLIFVEPEALGCLPDLPVVFGRGLLCGFDTLALGSQDAISVTMAISRLDAWEWSERGIGPIERP